MHLKMKNSNLIFEIVFLKTQELLMSFLKKMLIIDKKSGKIPQTLFSEKIKIF